ncbi:mechanosensitive ion channel family protein [Pedosphaera parvula]|uniref:MscS Mechanosensitive ion channel n=1 Tax=Pedosphaera parvula (strain Ellin514) TaxID=320771 RepID=B9XM38_PEDPL|nr:mechanosensitive ion channel family protein [Pedosphaera parvula]EEF59031.1 MscS Mechanosensitive ion channel [Pedosphaera parvula Ellin514]
MPTPEQVLEEVKDPEAWRGWVGQVGRVVLVLVIAWLLTRFTKWLLPRLRRSIVRILDRRREGVTLDLEKRAKTLSSALRKAINMVVWTLAVVAALKEFNYHVEPLLAGLGIAGIAVGLGAQTLIKDWLGGFFLLLEDQIRIGDLVVINEITGVVEEIDLRTTVLRGENGAVHVISNGSITTLSNLTREYSYYVFETTVAHGADADRALAIIEGVGDEIYGDEKYHSLILSRIEMMGVDCLGDRGVILKARIKTLPSQQLLVGRELNRRVNIRLKAEGIAFPQLLPPQVR